MDHIQASDSNTRTATQSTTFKLMDLPIEVRLMVFRQIIRQSTRVFPSIIQVSRQTREEATPILYHNQVFHLTLQPQPHTELIELAFDRRTRDWLEIVGTENISTLRYVVFRFPPTENSVIAASGYEMDLLCSDASNWEFQTKIDDKLVPGTLKRELEFRKNFVSSLFKDQPELLAAFRARHVKMCKAAIQHAQNALDHFHETCVVDRQIKTTVEALGVLAGALVAVEKARFQHPLP